MTSTFKPILWHALWNADVLSVPELHVKCERAIRERSIAERDFLVAQIGEEAWLRMLQAWGGRNGEQMASLQLGAGAVLTDFFTAPVTLAAADREAAAHLGTLANLLVGVYDDLIDAGDSGDDPLSRNLLDAPSGKSGAGEIGDTPLAPLVSAYFRQMASLPGAASRPEVARTLRRAILKMYDAERKTVGGGDADGRMAGWRRKSALPFVVMGLTAWLMTPDFCGRDYRRHLRWLCRCGEFWGWIDDAIDLEQDSATGHPNRVQAALQTGLQSPEALAAGIAQRGQAILTEWRQLTPQAARLPLAVQEALPNCLFSAFGGRPVAQLSPE